MNKKRSFIALLYIITLLMGCGKQSDLRSLDDGFEINKNADNNEDVKDNKNDSYLDVSGINPYNFDIYKLMSQKGYNCYIRHYDNSDYTQSEYDNRGKQTKMICVRNGDVIDESDLNQNIVANRFRWIIEMEYSKDYRISKWCYKNSDGKIIYIDRKRIDNTEILEYGSMDEQDSFEQGQAVYDEHDNIIKEKAYNYFSNDTIDWDMEISYNEHDNIVYKKINDHLPQESYTEYFYYYQDGLLVAYSWNNDTGDSGSENIYYNSERKPQNVYFVKDGIEQYLMREYIYSDEGLLSQEIGYASDGSSTYQIYYNYFRK